jgi:hypothetical protein
VHRCLRTVILCTVCKPFWFSAFAHWKRGLGSLLGLRTVFEPIIESPANQIFLSQTQLEVGDAHYNYVSHAKRYCFLFGNNTCIIVDRTKAQDEQISATPRITRRHKNCTFVLARCRACGILAQQTVYGPCSAGGRFYGVRGRFCYGALDIFFVKPK